MKGWMKGAVAGVALSLIVGGRAAAKNPTPPKQESTCGDYGTSVHFEDSPAEAAKEAKKDGRLVMVLHISGHFEDPKLT